MSCDASCDHIYVPLHHPKNKRKRKEKKRKRQIKIDKRKIK